ncbi:MAG: hypothetical protein KDA65_13020 [Planctomycetaceae bacterium]|nr:hypothetical protein [Planctomycetaceae bacterium]
MRTFAGLRGDSRILILCLILLCWLGMLIIHEGGHILLAWLSEGTVEKVVLHPLAISRTDVAPNPHPLAVVWGGPLLGVLIPLFAWGISRWLAPNLSYLLRFFAGFCLVTNGLYLGVAPLDAVGDARELLRLGAPLWLLVLFGLCSTVIGFLLWNDQGSEFGLGINPQRVNRRHLWGVLILTALIILAETCLSESS